jgi:hypothetical protein
MFCAGLLQLVFELAGVGVWWRVCGSSGEVRKRHQAGVTRAE